MIPEVPLGRRQLRVMVVDSHHGGAETASHTLERHFDEVWRFESAKHAVTALQSGLLPDVILMDARIGQRDMREFRALQEREALWSEIPLVVDADASQQQPLDEQTLLQTLDREVAARARRHGLARERELDRLVSLGALLAGISHEINNPLAIAIGGIDVAHSALSRLRRTVCASDAPAITTALRALDNAHVGVQRVNAVVRTAAVFATPDLEQIEAIDVRAVLESSLQIVSNELRHAARLERDLEEVPHVRGNSARLGQVFLNLLLNAITAVRDSGGRDHVVRVGLRRRGNDVAISIADTASSLDHDAENGAEPLEAMSSANTKLRLDLAVSNELVHDMGGRIERERILPSGATYHVWLPIQKGAESRSGARSQPRSEPVQSRAILVVDDELLICKVLKVILAEDYDVTTFTSADEGLAALREHDYGVILCDMMMPEMSGSEFFEQAVRIRPELRDRFVFITAGAFTPQAQAFVKQVGRPVLHKPCSRRELLAAIASTLGTATMEVS